MRTSCRGTPRPRTPLGGSLMGLPQGRVNALTHRHPSPLLRHQGEVEISRKPLPATGTRRRPGLLSKCLALVAGVAPGPNP